MRCSLKKARTESPARPYSNKLTFVINTSLSLLGAFLGFCISEATYRIYLYRTEPYQFKGDRNVWYLHSSPVRFSEEFGFEYVPGEHDGGAIYNGRVIACWSPMEEWLINDQGNTGRIKGTYENANFKVLVFGDSFTQRPRYNSQREPMTWPNFLQDILQEELLKPVHVVNFSRDGYGVLQMFDLAVSKIREWQPDLAIIAFITDDLTRDRFWRTKTFLDGRERILISTKPDPNPDWKTATDAFLLEPRATREWCQRLVMSAKKDDPIVQDLENGLVEGRRRSSQLADPLSLSQSFVFDRIVHGDPYHTTYSRWAPSQMPRYRMWDFNHDTRILANIRALAEMKIPYVLVHLATYEELEQRQEYVVRGKELERYQALAASLAGLTQRPIYGSVEHTRFPAGDLRKIAVGPPRDPHPSLYGHQFYAEIVAQILRDHGYLTQFAKRSG